MSRSIYIDDKVDYPAHWVASHIAMTARFPRKRLVIITSNQSDSRHRGGGWRSTCTGCGSPMDVLTAEVVSSVGGGHGCEVQVGEMEPRPGDCCVPSALTRHLRAGERRQRSLP